MATDAAPPAMDVLPSLSLAELRDALKRMDDAYERKHGAKTRFESVAVCLTKDLEKHGERGSGTF